MQSQVSNLALLFLYQGSAFTLHCHCLLKYLIFLIYLHLIKSSFLQWTKSAISAL